MSFAVILKSLDDKALGKLAAKVPSWNGVSVEVPASLNLQQCSGESAARYKASVVPSGSRVADLTGGLGVDSWAFSLGASAVWYNERNVVLKEAVARNFAALGVSNVVFNGYDIALAATDWQDALRAFGPDVIYLDPARRDAAGRKLFLLEDCSPDVVSLMPLLLELAPLVMVKVSPMADITMLQRRLSGWLSELHVVGAEGECKELLCLCRRNAVFAGITLAEDGFVLPDSGSASQDLPPKDFAPSGLIPPTVIRSSSESELSSALRITAGPSRSRGHGRPRSSEASPASATTESGNQLLFVPSAAMVKSGLGPGMCVMPFNERLIHFGKYWQVIENLPFASSQLKELGRRFPQADVTARGVPISSEELRRRLGCKPGGSIHIFACTLSADRRLLICHPA